MRDFVSAIRAHTVILFPVFPVAMCFCCCCKCHRTRCNLPSVSCNIVWVMFVKLLLLRLILPWSYGHLALQLAVARARGIFHQEENWPCSGPPRYCVPCCAPLIHDGVSACRSQSRVLHRRWPDQNREGVSAKRWVQTHFRNLMFSTLILVVMVANQGHTNTANHVNRPYWPQAAVRFFPVLPWTLHFIPISRKLISCVIPSGRYCFQFSRQRFSVWMFSW
jgi:hypothetical protein